MAETQDEGSGRISKDDRRGNAIADELAGYASQNHNESMAMYAQETVRTYDEHRKLVHRIHKRMLRSHQQDTRLSMDQTEDCQHR